MTSGRVSSLRLVLICLNAPFGARRFMTLYEGMVLRRRCDQVLMHRLALGAL